MRNTTLMLFQLLLGVFAAYAVLGGIPNVNPIVPLLCLVAMAVIGRYPRVATDSN